MVKKNFGLFLIFLFFSLPNINAQEQQFLHPSDVVTKMKARFKEMQGYQANFVIISSDGKKITSKGVVYYKQGGKINFTFSRPSGDKIISDGKRLWVYIASLRAVGIQDLQHQDKDGKSIYQTASYDGLVALFRQYHYSFRSSEQPETIDGEKYYVFQLKEKVASGGFTSMLLYVSPQDYLIHRLKAVSASGREVELQFSSLQVNPDLPNNLFTFEIKGNIRVIENPLTVN